MARSSRLELRGSSLMSWPTLPDGVISVKEYSSRVGFYATVTDGLRQTALGSGDYVHFQYDDEFGLIRASRVEPPDDYDPNTDPETPIQDNLSDGESYRVTLPRNLVEYDLGLPVEDYDSNSDPFLLRFDVDPELPKEEREFFALTPLGFASEVFRNPNRHDISSPIPDALANEYADEFDLVPRELRSFFQEVSDWTDQQTFEALTIEPEYQPTRTSHKGQEVSIEYLSQGSIGGIAELFDASPEHVNALFRLHYEVAATLVERIYAAENERPPADHPLVDDTVEVEPFIVPQTDQIQSGVSAAEGRITVPPVTPQVILETTGLSPVGKETLKGALSALASTLESTDEHVVAGDTRSVERIRDPVVLPMAPSHDLEPAYDEIRIEFMPSGAGHELAHDGIGDSVDDPDAVAMAVQEAYNRQAERLLQDADVEKGLARFRERADAVLIPVDKS